MTSTVPAAPPQAGVGRKVLHMLGVILLFVLLGPLVGGVVTIVGLAVSAGFPDPGAVLAVILTMMIYGLWTSYPMGFLPALLAGTAVGFMDAFRGGASLGFALALGFAMGFAWGMMSGGISDPTTSLVTILIGVACIAATVVCWYATRWRARV